ncbi:hypothetical protein T552_04172 [Pneumocystis carinii B80]|uniref:IMS import disulfide relay-system CHCH-CHCH-like Cx9C domain-containing protein n=1 Tax=Pneumocystis carinii (strain B80) TaxID=1408658 RepID=A0A0W4ZEA6_PNEC8|nr:hypothetical protein T552_04172 [Pneumocystis carinii B80]KTW26682.1 hypothetical protein T552_04172 [Pneumocystis carinii B80]
MEKNSQVIQKFILASKSCSILGTIYGKCIIKNTNNIQKDTCISEFQKFKSCLENIVCSKYT